MVKNLINKKNQKYLITVLLLLVLPLLILAVKEIQDIRNRAQGTDEVELSFSPPSGTFSPGQTVDVKIALANTTQRAINLSGAEAVVAVSDKFTVNSANCQAPFNGLPFTRINGQSVTLMCAISTSDTPVAIGSTDVFFASLSLTVNSSAADGDAPLTFTSTRSTEAGVPGQAPDVSTAGISAGYLVSSSGSITPPVSGDVVLSFSPAQLSLPPDGQVKIMANAGGKNIAFVRLVLTFDQSKVNLGSEVTTNPNLSTTVEKTSMTAANSQGKAVVVVAAAPSDSQPTDSFELASFSLKAVSTQTNDSTTINFLSSDMQIVDGQGTNLTIGAVPLNISIGGGGGTPPVSGDVVLSFSPAQLSLPPDGQVKIMANAGGKNIAFVRLVLTFDQSKVNLGSEVTTNPNLSTTVEKSTMSAANSAGKAIIVIAASPTDSQPTGSFEFASFTLKSVSSVENDSTEVIYDTADMQIVDGTGTAIAVSPSSLALTLNSDGVTVQPTSPPTGDDYEVPIGTKDSLTISIGGGGPTPTQPPGTIPQITFSTKLNHTVNNPEMYMRLRVKDDLFFLDNPGAQKGTCSQAGAGEKDFYVPMRHDGNVYRPVSSINATAPGGTIADVTPDGWVVLNGITAENYYTFILKAPKFRGTQTSEHNFLSGGQNSGQNFAWDASPLEPGDLLNPNQGSVQDCTVNSVDISLMVSRLGTTDQANLDVADVNFDSIVNGNDISKVVNTLSSKPDDDL